LPSSHARVPPSTDMFFFHNSGVSGYRRLMNESIWEWTLEKGDQLHDMAYIFLDECGRIWLDKEALVREKVVP
jgi:hypothetical protein